MNLPQPNIEYTLEYQCGCKERWWVVQKWENELQHKLVEPWSDCYWQYCTDTDAHESGRCKAADSHKP